ncbi:MAG: ATP-binding cassette domain-containing protein [Candidatus Aminicenantes bacterium]|nr:ATP-binding cassette domain-containing protein [Candidatus Aminicenantes bacterium]
MSLKLQNISKNFKQFALKEINLEIKQGEYFVILGPSGAGKTLILEMIAGLLKPDAGAVSGIDRGKIGFIYQDYMLFPHLTVYENIAYGLKIRKRDSREIKALIEKLAARQDIEHLLQRDVLNLSGGEKQRVAIARALAVSPRVFLLDEPTAALDRNARIKTRSMFMDLHKETAATFVHVTHDFEEALALADRIAILIDGGIVQCGRPDDVFNNPAGKETADFLGYRNVFGGKVENGLIDIDGVTVAVPLEKADYAYIAIRTDDIIISKQRIESSARNSFYGTVKNVINKSSMVEVVLEVGGAGSAPPNGIELAVDITRKSKEEMGIEPGMPMWATFKVSSIKIFRH